MLAPPRRGGDHRPEVQPGRRRAGRGEDDRRRRSGRPGRRRLQHAARAEHRRAAAVRRLQRFARPRCLRNIPCVTTVPGYLAAACPAASRAVYRRQRGAYCYGRCSHGAASMPPELPRQRDPRSGLPTAWCGRCCIPGVRRGTPERSARANAGGQLPGPDGTGRHLPPSSRTQLCSVLATVSAGSVVAGIQFPGHGRARRRHGQETAIGIKTWGLARLRGFVELGNGDSSVQPGNDRPRLFRLPSSRAIINRMGFNNRGASGPGRSTGGCRRGPGGNMARPASRSVSPSARPRTVTGRGDRGHSLHCAILEPYRGLSRRERLQPQHPWTAVPARCQPLPNLIQALVTEAWRLADGDPTGADLRQRSRQT